jgi:hypothetical protein
MRALLFAALIGAISAFQPCHSAAPECNGEWECPRTVSGFTQLSYHPTYGMICNIENGGESFSMELSDMCPLGGSIVDNSMCQVITNVTSTGCPDQTEPIRTAADGSIEGCAIKYPIFCPPGYAYFREYTECKRFAAAECVNKTEVATPCGYYCRDGLAPVHLGLSSDEYPICLYTKYAAPADGCPTPEALIDGYCIGYYEALYNDCWSATVSATPVPEEHISASPEPSREAPSPSSNPEPSREASSPSSNPEPSREASSQSSKPEPSREAPSQSSNPKPSSSPVPCEHRWCPYPLKTAPDGLCVDRMTASSYPQCEQVSHAFMPSLNQCVEWTMAPFTSPTDCPIGFSVHVVQNVEMCLRLYDPQWRPCPPEYDLIQSSTGERYCERVEAPKCGCPQPGNYSGCEGTNFYDAIENMCYTWFEFTSTMRECPAPYILVPRNDKLFCAQPYAPIQTSCPPGFTIAIRADGTEFCQTIEGEPCDSSAAPAEMTAAATQTAKPYERPTETATHTAKPEEPSYSPEPSRDKSTETATHTAKPEEPSHSPEPSTEKPTETATQTAKPEEPSRSSEPSREKPSETSSPSPVSKPVISATIRIEISTSLTQNTTSDMSVFQEPEVLMSLKDAIARALGVPVDMVRIESVAWINNGVVMSTVQILNATGGRRLQSGDNYDIKYKVVDPPAELLALRPEEFASRVEASTAVLSAAATAVSAVTGAAISANDIVVQSVEMAVAAPAAAQAAPQSSSLPIAAIAGGAGGGFVLIGAAIAVAMTIYHKQKHRSQAAARTATAVQQQAPLAETTFKADRIMVVNPMANGPGSTPQFVMQNKNFSFAYSARDLETAFTPRQARRV